MADEKELNEEEQEMTVTLLLWMMIQKWSAWC